MLEANQTLYISGGAVVHGFVNAKRTEVSEITFRDIVVENAQMGSGDGSEMPYLIDLFITKNNN